MTPVETQPERTALAWQRTGLGVLAVAALLGHRALEVGHPALLVVAGVAALLGLGVLGGLAPARYRQVQDRVAGGRAVTTSVPALAATGVVVLTALAAAVAVLVPG
ncbi:DUF202 domain-containing protein [Blastococcus sp. HT6-30]|uniref:DUF202 domain-containing protein n=1 Tax=Blastococcus sp. HT6-30 TaxID=3144843 RepID=UPI003219D8A1